MLAAEIRHQGGRPKPSHDAMVLADLGVNLSQSSRWQKVAGVPPKVVDDHATRCELTPGVGAWAV